MVEIKEEDKLDKIFTSVVNIIESHRNLDGIGEYWDEMVEKFKENNQQILQDHEDAKKWRELKETDIMRFPKGNHAGKEVLMKPYQKDRQIVKRLEERIKELPKIRGSDTGEWVRECCVKELQKILENEDSNE